MPTASRIRYVKKSPVNTRATRYAVHLDGTLVGTLGSNHGGQWRWTHAVTVPARASTDNQDSDHTDWEANRRDATVSLLATAGLPRGVAWSIVLDDMDDNEEPFVQEFLATLEAKPAQPTSSPDAST